MASSAMLGVSGRVSTQFPVKGQRNRSKVQKVEEMVWRWWRKERAIIEAADTTLMLIALDKLNYANLMW